MELKKVVDLSLVKGIILGIFYLLITILLPYLLFGWLRDFFPYALSQYFPILNLNLIIQNGIIFTVIFTFWSLMKQGTLLRLIGQCAILMITLYFFFVGNSLFSFFLPQQSFASILIQSNAIFYYIRVEFLELALLILFIELLYIMKSAIEFYKNLYE